MLEKRDNIERIRDSLNRLLNNLPITHEEFEELDGVRLKIIKRINEQEKGKM